MFKRILCPVDFSAASRHAIDQASTIARWYGATVTALHVCDPAFGPLAGLPDSSRRADREMARLRGEVAACFETASRAGVQVDAVIDVGQPDSCILDRARTWPADLIVMGTHGVGGFEHLLLGSVAEKVLRLAVCAVLTVPPHATRTSILPFKRVLCAVDFSEWSLRALEFGRSLALESRAAMTAMTVIEWPWPEPPPPAFAELPPEQAAALREYRRYVETGATRRLATLADESASTGVALDVRVDHGKSYVEILRCAADIGADLIVMGVHGRKQIDLEVFGSTTNQVVRQATCPVLTLRTPAQRMAPSAVTPV
jgi:nucleotide-binding universal stress UspA family protein